MFGKAAGLTPLTQALNYMYTEAGLLCCPGHGLADPSKVSLM